MADRPYAYASAPDVVAHLTFVATFTATSKPNATQVHGYLIDTAQDLDSALVSGDYTTPIPTTATQAMQQLNSWNAIGGALYSANAMPQGGDSKHAAFLERRWDAILTGLSEGTLKLPDAGLDTTLSRPRYAGVATPTFTRGDDV